MGWPLTRISPRTWEKAVGGFGRCGERRRRRGGRRRRAAGPPQSRIDLQPAQPQQRLLGRAVVANPRCLHLVVHANVHAVHASPDAPPAAPHLAELHKPAQGLIRAGNGGFAS
jgi:hypothetical protein